MRKHKSSMNNISQNENKKREDGEDEAAAAAAAEDCFVYSHKAIKRNTLTS